MALTSAQIDAIVQQLYRQFPEVRGTRPAVQSQVGAKTGGLPEHFVLIFQGRGQGPNGQSIPRIMRVVADARGKVLKISTSR